MNRNDVVEFTYKGKKAKGRVLDIDSSRDPNVNVLVGDIENPDKHYMIPMKDLKLSNSFQNGRAVAEQEIMNKANQVGMKLKICPL